MKLVLFDDTVPACSPTAGCSTSPPRSASATPARGRSSGSLPIGTCCGRSSSRHPASRGPRVGAAAGARAAAGEDPLHGRQLPRGDGRGAVADQRLLRLLRRDPRPGRHGRSPRRRLHVCHHEAELVCVIGKEGRDVSRADAMGYVFGYTAGVDVSARGAWGFLGKSCDGFKPIGPCHRDGRRLADPHALDVQLSVDGVVRQDYSTSDIGHRIPECIEWFSSFLTIRPGDLLFVGTNHQQLGPLQDGETVEMGIGSIGSFTFHVADPKRRSWPKEVDASVGENLRRRLETAGAA